MEKYVRRCILAFLVAGIIEGANDGRGRGRQGLSLLLLCSFAS